jgi:hypothetical protein
MHKPTLLLRLLQNFSYWISTQEVGFVFAWAGKGYVSKASVFFSLLYIILITVHVAGGTTIIVSLCFTAEKWKLIVV